MTSLFDCYYLPKLPMLACSDIWKKMCSKPKETNEVGEDMQL